MSESANQSASRTTAAAVTGRVRELPPVMRIAFEPGQLVELREDQVFSDRVVIRRGERGKTMYPSSQAAAWVVSFPRVGPKLRVIPEHLLQPAS